MANKRKLSRPSKPSIKPPGDDSPKSRPAPAKATNRSSPTPPGERKSAPGAGVVRTTADVRKRAARPGRDERLASRRATKSSPGAERPGTTDQRPGATAARGGAIGGLGVIETSEQGRTAYNPPTGGTGAPEPGSSGIPETADPNYPADKNQYRSGQKRGAARSRSAKTSSARPR